MDNINQYGWTQKLAALRQRIVDLEQRQHSRLTQAGRKRAMLRGAPQWRKAVLLARIWAQMERLAQTVAYERKLAQVIARIRQTLDIETIVSATTQEVRQILSCDRVALYRFCPDWSVEFVFESVACGWISLKAVKAQTVWRDTELQTTRGGKYHNHECSAVHDIYCSALSNCHIEILEQFQIRAYLIAPVFVDKKLWGLLAAHQNSGPRRWKQRELNLLTQVGSQLGVALQQANLLAREQEAKEKADAANRAKSDFIARISHELRTPLNSILGFSQVLAHDARLSPTQREQLGAIVHSGEHLSGLLDNALEMFRLETSRAVLKQVSFDLYGLLNSLAAVFQLKANAKRVQLIVDYDSNIPQYICTDEGKLRQVLINLLDNAVKFTQTGCIFVRVKVKNQGLEVRGQGRGNREERLEKRKERSEHPKLETSSSPQFLIPSPQFLIFEVEDTGPGIASAELNRLFQPFVQTDAGLRSREGTGLGLAICQQFIELMGGTITVESVLGQGSVFQFNIQVGLPQFQALASGCNNFVSQTLRAEMIFDRMAEPLVGRYCYAGDYNTDNPAKAVHAVVMDPEAVYTALASMSGDWLNKLRQAALSAREKRLFDLIEQIPAEHSLLNQILTQWVNTLQFDQIVDLISHSTYGSPQA